ncbi:MAG: choice-of-anchor J domain-containing protein [Candidatus Delongbacteria bacterium]|nr:choice-of-anchor J domain-containing protein [Candidatus Delongbacteria bacterium]
MFENIWGDYDHGSLHIVFGSTNDDSWDSMNGGGWRTNFFPNLTYYVSTASELGSLYGGFGNGYVPYNVVVGPGYQAYMIGNTFTTEEELTGPIDNALANFAFYPENIPVKQDVYFNEQIVVDLSGVMYNESGSEITYEVFENSDTQAIAATINGSELTLSIYEKMAIVELTIKVNITGKESMFKMQVETYDPTLYENLYESFEETYENIGWTLKTTGVGWVRTTDSYSGSFAAAHSWDNGDHNDWIFSPKYAITGDAVLTFFEKTRYSEDGIHSVGISTDLNRTTVIAYNLPHTENWQQNYIDLSAYDGQEIYIGFNYKTDADAVLDDNDLWAIDNVRLWTTTGINDQPMVVNGNTLYQNYPNPFNPTTEIKFSLENNSNVKLDVYNSNGEVVSSLVNNMLEKGSHSVSFNASEITGGIYFYQLEVDGKSMTKKMLLLK